MSRVNEAGNYTQPKMRKRLYLIELKQAVKVVVQDNGLLVKHRC